MDREVTMVEAGEVILAPPSAGGRSIDQSQEAKV